MTSKAMMAVAVAVVIGGKPARHSAARPLDAIQGVSIGGMMAGSRALSGTGNDSSFQVHDWNGDGILFGDEAEPGRMPRTDEEAAVGRRRPRDLQRLDGPRLQSVDRNRDNRITADESGALLPGSFRAGAITRANGIVTRSESSMMMRIGTRAERRLRRHGPAQRRQPDWRDERRCSSARFLFRCIPRTAMAG